MKFLTVLLLVIALLAFARPVLAMDQPAPLGACPPAFELHYMMPDGPHMHEQIGIDTDANGDGYVCIQHVGPNGSLHLHTDNNLPLP